MNASRGPAGWRRWLILLIPPALFGVYQVVLHGVRLHVDGRIARSVDAPLPAFRLPGVDGGLYSSEQLGGRIGILHFFRSYCSNCIAEKDDVRAFSDALGEDVVMWSVLMDPVMGFEAAATEQTLARSNFHHPVLLADAAFVDAFHGSGWAKVTPVTYFVSPEGTVVATLRGAQTRQSLEATLDSVRNDRSDRPGGNPAPGAAPPDRP
jgi:peroxiredoxin